MKITDVKISTQGSHISKSFLPEKVSRRANPRALQDITVKDPIAEQSIK
jgi:hypothetical protein